MLNEEITLTGDLSKISIAQVFHAISISKATGIFSWEHGSRKKKAFIKNGRIVFASSNQDGERLGEVLLRKGRVRVKDFMAASKQVKEQKRLGQILIEMGALTREDIKKGVILQVQEIIYSLFNESKGEYTFQEQVELPKEVITLDINTPELILGGVERITDWNLIVQNLSGIDTIFELASGVDKKRLQTSLSDHEIQVLELVDGEKSVQKICSLLGGNDFETCRTLMGLLCANLIRRITDSEFAVVEEKKAENFFSKTVLCYNRLFSYVYRYLSEKVGKLGDTNLSHYLEEIKDEHPVLLKGIFLLPDGTLAGKVLRENYEQLSTDERRKALLSALKDLLSAELAALRESLGGTEEAFVTSRLKQIMETLKKDEG